MFNIADGRKAVDKESLDKKAGEILASLTDREKCLLLFGNGMWKTHGIKGKGVPEVEMHDGPLGLRVPLDEKTSGFMEPVEKATCFPSPALLACSWDPVLLESVGSMVAKEAITLHTDLLLAPGINIKRNPLCGRNFEYFSEDPVLAGVLGASYIKGVQKEGVGACLKHFALNNQEHNRFAYSAEVDERTMREFYLRPFEIAVKEGQPWAVMAAYNRVNGTFCSDNSYLLEDVLFASWNFQGPVISDWGGTADPVRSHDFGLSLEMPCSFSRLPELRRALRKGELSRSKLDEASLRMIKLSLLATSRPKEAEGWRFADSHALARKAAAESIVLARNERNILPLKDYEDCAVIGGIAERMPFQGKGSSRVTAQAATNFLSAIPDEDIAYAQGYPMGLPNELSAQELMQEAVEVASRAKNVILFLGLPEGIESEGDDRKDMRLPSDQMALFEAVRAINRNTVVVLVGGAPVELDSLLDSPGLVLSYLGGEAGAEAIDDVLSGRVNPSGKLAETWPLRYSDVPSSSYYGKEIRTAPYMESFFVGYRYFCSSKVVPGLPFGHGLSYTEFSYRGARLNLETKTIEIDLENAGSRPGEEVVQVYARYEGKDALMPERQLCCFGKVALLPKEHKTVSLQIPDRTFEIWDSSSHSFKKLAGKYSLLVGSSSSDIRLEPIPFEVARDKESYKADKTYLLSLKAYFDFRKKGVLEVDQDSFSALLGRHPTADIASSPRPFDLNSTIRELEDCHFGKFIGGIIRKRFRGKSEAELSAAIDVPIRMVSVFSSPKFAGFIVECCNGRFLHGFVRLFIGTRGMRFRA